MGYFHSAHNPNEKCRNQRGICEKRRDCPKWQTVYFENTMRYEPIGWQYGGNYLILTGHDIQPLIDYLNSI